MSHKFDENLYFEATEITNRPWKKLIADAYGMLIRMYIYEHS